MRFYCTSSHSVYTNLHAFCQNLRHTLSLFVYCQLEIEGNLPKIGDCHYRPRDLMVHSLKFLLDCNLVEVGECCIYCIREITNITA